jgi:hypothetical protein
MYKRHLNFTEQKDTIEKHVVVNPRTRISIQTLERIRVVKQTSVTEIIRPAPQTLTTEHRDLLLESWHYVEKHVNKVSKIITIFILLLVLENHFDIILCMHIFDFTLGRNHCIQRSIHSITRIKDDVSISTTL